MCKAGCENEQVCITSHSARRFHEKFVPSEKTRDNLSPQSINSETLDVVFKLEFLEHEVEFGCTALRY